MFIKLVGCLKTAENRCNFSGCAIGKMPFFRFGNLFEFLYILTRLILRIFRKDDHELKIIKIVIFFQDLFIEVEGIALDAVQLRTEKRHNTDLILKTQAAISFRLQMVNILHIFSKNRKMREVVLSGGKKTNRQ